MHNSSNNEKHIINKDVNKIKSIEGYDCIGPCYPPNTIYYNPLNLTITLSEFPSCPIKEKVVLNSDGKKNKIYSDRCYDKDINKGHMYFDIFSDYIQISTTSEKFLAEIYNLNNISDIVYFMSNSIDTLPIYSQRRILKAIFEVYYKYAEFPKNLFSKKILFVLKNIYKINNLDENKILKKLNNSSENKITDIYDYFN